jgi:isohexenylglutaconyl-CoA hydratase
MSAPQYETLLVTEEAGVLHITLNRPELKNAMSLQMVSDLLAVLDMAEASEDTRVIVLRGAGGNFCSGGDIKDMGTARMKAASGDTSAITETSMRFGRLCERFAKSRLPIVCALEGVVMGGGFGLACVADVAIASEDVTFALPETGLGLIPAQIMPFLLQRLGYSQTKRLAVTGGKVFSEEALAIGLIHEVTDDLKAALAATTKKIIRCAPQATAVTKKLVQDVYTNQLDDIVDHAAGLFTAASAGEEGAEGTSAFIAKRLPAWAEETS